MSQQLDYQNCDEEIKILFFLLNSSSTLLISSNDLRWSEPNLSLRKWPWIRKKLQTLATSGVFGLSGFWCRGQNKNVSIRVFVYNTDVSVWDIEDRNHTWKYGRIWTWLQRWIKITGNFGTIWNLRTHMQVSKAFAFQLNCFLNSL